MDVCIAFVSTSEHDSMMVMMGMIIAMVIT